MYAAQKLKLQKLLNKQFGDGINKAHLMEALEEFIDENYHEVRGKTYLSTFVKELDAAGGYKTWKKQFQLGILSELLSAGLISLHPPYAGGLDEDQRRAQKNHRAKIRKLLSEYKEEK